MGSREKREGSIGLRGRWQRCDPGAKDVSSEGERRCTAKGGRTPTNRVPLAVANESIGTVSANRKMPEREKASARARVGQGTLELTSGWRGQRAALPPLRVAVIVDHESFKGQSRVISLPLDPKNGERPVHQERGRSKPDAAAVFASCPPPSHIIFQNPRHAPSTNPNG